ncbi:hypothetical protein [Umezawaea sp. Da 62-37]|uniref:hypothetical protein n=1 Tax=Umezawaea sp. Da 62-37 TaxID=3075927 RepID=UPI0028F6F6F2|nr:hypothetical protein [Umezawaea sp. Da 62-37]WNV84147.1 hypothetical protein RM788_39205 [Umezawaea sp. Da 62-37]
MTAVDPGATLSHRALALLRATAAGRVELTFSSEPDFRVDQLPCCDQPAARVLVHAGLVEPAVAAPPGHWVPAHLSPAGIQLLTLNTPYAAA